MTPELANILGPLGTLVVVVVFLLIQYRTNNKKGNPGNNNRMEKKLDTIIEKLDDIGRDVAVLKDRR